MKAESPAAGCDRLSRRRCGLIRSQATPIPSYIPPPWPASHMPGPMSHAACRTGQAGSCGQQAHSGPAGRTKARPGAGREGASASGVLRRGSKKPLHRCRSLIGFGRARALPEPGRSGAIGQSRLCSGAVLVAQRRCASIVGDVHTASHKPARRRGGLALSAMPPTVGLDGGASDIRFVFGVACYVLSGAFPKRETRNPKRNGGREHPG